VAVAVQSQGYGGVPQEFLYEPGMVAAREQQRGASVSEIVKPYIWQLGSFQERLERGPGNVVRVQRSPSVGTENELVILPQITCL
jgi:hypothetical protein